jgi:hypothetical protein
MTVHRVRHHRTVRHRNLRAGAFAHDEGIPRCPSHRTGRQMRRFTRLTNGFSKKIENHAAMVSLYFMYYNFARVYQTLRVTPAMEAGISGHVWSIEEIVGLLGR